MTTLAEHARAGNLPAEVTRFIGRRTELAEVKRALERSRLVTLCGVGGVGKTRLALRAAADLRRSFADGAWMVELSALREPELVPRAVAEALKLPDRAVGRPVDQIADHVADRHLLLVLDTCEHLVDACAMLSEVLLRAAPGLRILATSRQPLEVMGESISVVPPLATVGSDLPDSLVLFTERAEAMVPGFALTEDNRAMVAGLCDRLDGIPLAIELAAVRLRAMSVEQLAARLGDRFRVLGTQRGTRDRHQTLRATVGWSHELCDPQERLLWARLSVFPGDFDLAAAEQVCADDELPAEGLLDVLARLVEKSILLIDQTAGRYRMLDTIREYGAELSSGEQVRRRHRDHYFGLVQEVADGAMGPRQPELLARLRAEHHNVRVALDDALTAAEPDPRTLRILGSLHLYWVAVGLFSEGRAWLARALAKHPEPGRDRGEAVFSAAVLASLQGDFDAARALIDELSEAAQGHRALAVRAVHAQAMVHFCEGGLEEARAGLTEAIEGYSELGYPDPYALAAHPHLVPVCFMLGDVARAFEVAEECIKICDATGEQWCRAYAVLVRGQTRWITGDLEGARADALSCLKVKEEADDLLGIALSVDLAAAALAAEGETERGARLLGATNAMWRTMSAPMMSPHYMGTRELVLATAREALGVERCDSALRQGTRLSVAEAAALARGESAAAAPPPTAPADPLTRREREIANLVAQGLSNREIAERLVIAKRTVDSHLEHILAKLGFTSRTQIAAWAAAKPDG